MINFLIVLWNYCYLFLLSHNELVVFSRNAVWFFFLYFILLYLYFTILESVMNAGLPLYLENREKSGNLKLTRRVREYENRPKNQGISLNWLIGNRRSSELPINVGSRMCVIWASTNSCKCPNYLISIQGNPGIVHLITAGFCNH